MPLLLTYSLRNLSVRKLTTALTAGGMALVVFVYAAALMLDAGLKQTLVATGDEANVIFVRRGAEVEIQSSIDRQQARVIESAPEVAIGSKGEKCPFELRMALGILHQINTGQPSIARLAQ